MSQQVRVRFAPSPTGALHIGGVRTALYNYLFARQNDGVFVLRIEDTDQTRYVAGAEDYIYESLEWLGLIPDESPKVGGNYGPYRQSERKDLYRQYVDQLIEQGHAYYAFDTDQELEAMRERLKAAKAKNLSYNAITRRQMKNSLTLDAQAVQELMDAGTPYVVRIKMPLKEEIRFQDRVFDWVKAHSSTLDDKVLLKSDGMPTYHLANVVDDYLMKITHVIRGKEWLPSSYLHVLLYEYLGWGEQRPEFVHLPLILKPSGEGKLSKRDAQEYGVPVFPLEYHDPKSKEILTGFREEGYFSEGLINFLAFLGWNPGTEQEIFSLKQLVSDFSLDRIGKSDPVFPVDKAKWYNQQYLKEMEDSRILAMMKSRAQHQGISLPDWEDAKFTALVDLMKDRITFPGDILEEASYVFQAPESYDEKTLKKKWNEVSSAFVKDLKDTFAKDEGAWEAEHIKHLLQDLIEKQELKFGKVMAGVRLAVTGLGGGPDLMVVMELIGKEETLARMEKALSELNK